jgi:hypothetical protein
MTQSAAASKGLLREKRSLRKGVWTLLPRFRSAALLSGAQTGARRLAAPSDF